MHHRANKGRRREYYESWGDDLHLLVGSHPKYCMRRSTEAPIRAVARSLSRLSECRIEPVLVGEMVDAVTGRPREIYEIHAWAWDGDLIENIEKDMCVFWVAVYKDRQLKLPL